MRSLLLLAALVAAPAGAQTPSAPTANRVVSLPVDALKARYLDAGDHADVLWTHQTPAGWVTETVAMDVVVTAIKVAGAKAELSVSAPRKSADVLALAVKKGGSFMLAARAPDDHHSFIVEPAVLERLFR